MKILFTIFSLETGGAQTFMIRLANELAKTDQVFVYDHN
ncbi:MAG: glycosyltransferase, partial [Bacteroidia bacterium]|nr:glycosyltransferase [Bacteroidia bacterium]